MFTTQCQSCNILNSTTDHIIQMNSFYILNITLAEMKEITSTRQKWTNRPLYKTHMKIIVMTEPCGLFQFL